MRFKSRLVTLLLAVGLGTGAALAVPGSSQADNIWIWIIDHPNNQVPFSTWALTTATHTSFHDTFNNNVNPTDITPSHFHEVTFEVTAYDAFYGGTGWVGQAVCIGYNAAAQDCDNVQVKVNLSYGPYGQLESDSIMCEEVGHALGLDHDFMPSGATCMSQNPANRRWNNHDKALINGWF